MRKILLASTLLTTGLSEFFPHQAQAQIVWESVDTPKAKPSSVKWETISEEKKHDVPQKDWQVVPELDEHNPPSSMVVWKVLEAEDEVSIPSSKTASNSVVTPPSNLEEAEALLDTIPLKPSDYEPLLRLSHLISTAETLPIEQWRISFDTISPSIATPAQAIKIIRSTSILGLNSLLLSFFVSQADDPLNATLNGFATRPAIFGKATARQAAGK